MKELYTSPELKVTCFAPVERLAADDLSGPIKFSWLVDLLDNSGNRPPANPSDDDLVVNLH